MFVSVVSGCISACASLVGDPVGITSFAVGLEICVIIAGITKYKLIIKKKRNKSKIKNSQNAVECII